MRLKKRPLTCLGNVCRYALLARITIHKHKMAKILRLASLAQDDRGEAWSLIASEHRSIEWCFQGGR